MNLLDHLNHFRDAMETYHDLLVAEAHGIGDFQYLQIGAGLRLPEKPRKNVERIGNAIEALRDNRPIQARTWLRAVYGSWRDHVGLHDEYIDTDQMTLAHALSHFGEHLTEQDFLAPHGEVVRSILQRMAAEEPLPDVCNPNAFSLGAALCTALAEINRQIG